MENETVSVPQEIHPLSTGTYVGLRILFLIPVVGFIFALILSFAPHNINLKSFCRSQLVLILIAVVGLSIFYLIVFLGIKNM